MTRPETPTGGQPANLVLIIADQLNPRYLGATGHPTVHTPNIDRLARAGTTFTQAYCASPICVPARAALATGRYPHQTHNWDNAHPYAGGVPSWGHRAAEAGSRVTTVGKLHYQDGADLGFADQRLGMGTDAAPDYFSLMRDNLPRRPELATMITGASTGNSSYTAYDRAVAAEAARWLATDASNTASPWVLMVSFVSPHHPLIAPEQYARLYPEESVDLPLDWTLDSQPHHPVLDALRGYYGYDGEFTDHQVRNARRIYLALTSFLDAQVGVVLGALHDSPAASNTRVLFTADHGDNVGDHGLWWKNNMYEGSVGIPLTLTGPGIPAGQVIASPVSQLDIYPTVLESIGAPAHAEDADLPGRSLLQMTGGEIDPRRAVFAEYHATGSITGTFMLRRGRYKYVEYVGFDPQLFDLVADPRERIDHAADPAFAAVLSRMREELRQVCDPVAVNSAAKQDQHALIEAMGGEDVVRARGFVTHMPVPPEIVGDFDDARASAGRIVGGDDPTDHPR